MTELTPNGLLACVLGWVAGAAMFFVSEYIANISSSWWLPMISFGVTFAVALGVRRWPIVGPRAR